MNFDPIASPDIPDAIVGRFRSLLAVVIEDKIGHDRAAKLILADFAKEHGLLLPPTTIYAYRWAAARGHHPRVSPKGRSVCWVRGDKRNAMLDYCVLPWRVFGSLRMKGNVRSVFRCKSVPHAFEALGEALERMKNDWEIDPKSPAQSFLEIGG